MIITADGGYRGNKVTELKAIVDEALKNCPSVDTCIVLKRTGSEINWVEGRDHWWDEVVEGQLDVCEPEIMDFLVKVVQKCGVDNVHVIADGKG